MNKAHAASLTGRFFRYLTLSAFLFALWCALSGHGETRMLVLGGLCALLASLLATLLTSLGVQLLPGDTGMGRALSWRGVFALPFYLLWLTKEIVKANLHVAAALLSPKLHRVSAQTLLIAPRMSHDSLRALFANSITLTPGTVTVETFHDLFLIHALTEQSADIESLDGMNRRLARLEYIDKGKAA